MRSRVLTQFATLVALFSLALAGTAFAADTPTQTVYGNPAGDVLGSVNTGGENDVIPPPKGGEAPADGDEIPAGGPVKDRERGGDTVPAAPSASGDLPFTGFESALVAMAGLALLGTGLAVRRATRTAPAA